MHATSSSIVAHRFETFEEVDNDDAVVDSDPGENDDSNDGRQPEGDDDDKHIEDVENDDVDGRAESVQSPTVEPPAVTPVVLKRKQASIAKLFTRR